MDALLTSNATIAMMKLIHFPDVKYYYYPCVIKNKWGFLLTKALFFKDFSCI